MWPWRVKMPTPTCWCCNCCWWWSCWQHFVTDLEAEVKKLTFFSNFEHNVWSKFWSWNSDKIWSWSSLSFLCWCFVEVMLNPSRILVDILKQGLGKILKLKFYGEADVWFRFWSWCLVEILKMKFDQDLYLNLWYELNPRVRCAFGNVWFWRLLRVALCNLTSYLRFHTNTFQKDEGGVFAVDHFGDSLEQER